MTSVTRVPVTTDMDGEELSADEAWPTIRHWRWAVLTQAFVRFRYGDGFTHSRALGLQLCLACIPLVIALVGLSGALGTAGMGEVLRSTVLAMTPGASDAIVQQTLERAGRGDDDASEAALWLGLLAAVAALTTAMGQVERGANRIYGIRRDRPTRVKYGRGLVLALLAGLPALAGFGVLLGGSAFGESVESVYGVDDDLVTGLALPAGVVLLLISITALLRHAPRRRQPGWTWVALGAGVALLLWLLLTGLLAGYVRLSQSFGTVYGPLSGIIALLLWAQLTAVAIFLGMAIAAQMEALRAGITAGAGDDPERAPAPVRGHGAPSREGPVVGTAGSTRS